MREPLNKEELCEVILDEWEKITTEEVNKWIVCMHLRVDEVIKNGGDSTGF